jgi:DNA-binding transcriptional LysR family regulator
MELRQLEHFQAAAEELNFTRAAARCHIVQSAMSASIRALERELGVPLFERSTRAIRLTEQGRTFLDGVGDVMTSLKRAADSVQNPGGELRGTVTIGVMQGAWRGMTDALRTMRGRHPALRIKLRQAPVSDLVDDVRRGRLDLAVVATESDGPDDGAVRELYREAMVLATSLNDPLAARSSVSLAELASREFVDFAPEWQLRRMLDAAFRRTGSTRSTSFEVNDLRVAGEIVSTGLGIMIVPPNLIDGMTALARVPLVEPILWRLSVVTTGSPGPAARAFAEVLSVREA